jgi:hypothetical protein
MAKKSKKDELRKALEKQTNDAFRIFVHEPNKKNMRTEQDNDITLYSYGEILAMKAKYESYMDENGSINLKNIPQQPFTFQEVFNEYQRRTHLTETIRISEKIYQEGYQDEPLHQHFFKLGLKQRIQPAEKYPAELRVVAELIRNGTIKLTKTFGAGVDLQNLLKSPEFDDLSSVSKNKMMNYFSDINRGFYKLEEIPQ